MSKLSASDTADLFRQAPDRFLDVGEDGIDHIALTTSSLDDDAAFFVDHFDAVVERRVPVNETLTMAVIRIGPHTELNVFEASDETQLAAGRLDHFGVHASDLEALEEIRRRPASLRTASRRRGPHRARRLNLPDISQSEIEVLLDAEHHDYAGSEAMVASIKAKLSPAVLAELKKPEVGEPVRYL